jgi:hypothetical protein
VGEGAGALPLLSYLMTDMWAAMQKGDAPELRLPGQAIDIGGVLAARAEAFLAAEPHREAALKRLLTLRLASVPPEGKPVRRQALKAECSAEEWALAAALAEAETLVGKEPLRLVVVHDSEAGLVAEVAHERLLDGWPKLEEWLRDEREFLIFKGEVERAERRWRGKQLKAEIALLFGLDLARAKEWFSSRRADLTEHVQNFIQASIKHDDAQKALELEKAKKQARVLRHFSFALGLVALAMIGVGLYANDRRADAERSKVQAQEAEKEKGRTVETLRATIQRVVRALDGVTDAMGDDRTGAIPGIDDVRKDVFGHILPVYQDLGPQVSALFGPGEVGELEQLKAQVNAVQINMAQSGGDSPILAARALLDRLLAAHDRRVEGEARRALAEMIYATGYRLIWRLMDIGRESDAGADAGKIVAKLDIRADVMAGAGYFRARALFINALARIARSGVRFPDGAIGLAQQEFLRSAMALGDAAEADARRALAHAPGDKASREIEALAQINRRLDFRQLGQPDKGQESLSKGCTTIRELLKAAPHVARYISLEAYCVSLEIYDLPGLAARDAPLAAAEQRLRTGLIINPHDDRLESDLLTNLYNQVNAMAGRADKAQIQKEKLQLYFRQFIKLMTSNDRLPQYIGDLSDNVKFVSDIVFGEPAERIALLQTAYEAVSSKRERYPEVRVLAEASAYLSATLVPLMRDAGNIGQAIDIGVKTTELIDKARLLEPKDQKPSEIYASLCGAFGGLTQTYIAVSRIDDARVALGTMRRLCTPLLERQPWDFYLRQHFMGGARRLGLALHAAGRYAEALPELSYASHWGDNDASKALAEIYQRGLTGVTDQNKADELIALAGKQSMKRFTVTTDFAGVKHPFDVYVLEWPSDYPFEGIDDQIEWVKQFRGGIVPDDVKTSFQKLHRIARENRVSFPDLAVYAFNVAKKEDETKKTEPQKP